MEKAPFFSVIMPSYGVEDYLENCVNSILKQSMNDFEIIIVDDASPDRTGEIADDLSRRDERVRVLHLAQNGRVGNARNKGFEQARGQYVFFIDPDDEIDSELFSKVKASLEKNPAQVTVYGICEEIFDSKGQLKKTKKITLDEESHYITDSEEIHRVVIELEKRTMYGYPWNKCFKREYLIEQGIIFQDVVLIEDIAFNVQVFQNITSLNILPLTDYKYKKRVNESLTHKFVKDYFKVHKERVRLVYDQQKSWNTCDENVKTIMGNIYARYIFSALCRNFDKRSEMSRSDRKLWLEEIFNDDLWNELCGYVTVGASLQGILSGFLKRKNKALCLMAGRFIYFVKNQLPVIFSLIN